MRRKAAYNCYYATVVALAIIYGCYKLVVHLIGLRKTPKPRPDPPNKNGTVTNVIATDPRSLSGTNQKHTHVPDT